MLSCCLLMCRRNSARRAAGAGGSCLGSFEERSQTRGGFQKAHHSFHTAPARQVASNIMLCDADTYLAINAHTCNC